MNIKLLLLLTAGLLFAALPARADESMEPPIPVRMVPPIYPSELRQAGLPGVVSISCLIDEKGNVTEPKVVKTTNEAFSQPALDAVLKWKFKPAKKGGTPIALRVTVPVQFSVSKD